MAEKIYWDKDIETMEHDKMVALQSERLVKQVRHVWDNVPYYRRLMEEKGVTPDDIKGVEDLHKLPLSQRLTCARTILTVCWLCQSLSACAYSPPAAPQARG